VVVCGLSGDGLRCGLRWSAVFRPTGGLLACFREIATLAFTSPYLESGSREKLGFLLFTNKKSHTSSPLVSLQGLF